MKIATKLQKILQFSDNPARIVDSVGLTFTYHIALNVDIKAALRGRAHIIELTAYSSDPDSFATIPISKEPSAMVSLILTSAAKKKEEVSKQRRLAIATAKVDITKSVDNSSIKKTIATNVIATPKTIEVSSFQKGIDSKIVSKMSPISAAFSLLDNGIDPANAFSLVTQTYTTKDIAAGTLTPAVSADANIKAACHTLTFNMTQGFSAGKLTNSSIRNRLRALGGKISISSDKIVQAKFVVIARLMADDGKEIAVSKTIIDHGQCVRLYNTPHKPPQVKISGDHGNGRVGIDIRQIDPHAASVIILKRIISPTDAMTTSSSYVKIANLSISRQNGFIKFFDDTHGMKTAIYRFIAVGKKGEIGKNFSSIISRPQKQHGTAHRRNQLLTISIVSHNVDSGISTVLTKFPPSARAVVLFRRDMTLHEQIPVVINTADQIILVNDRNDEITFTDVWTKPDHIYEYTAKIVDKSGSVLDCVGTFVIKRVPSSSTSTELSITDIKIEKTNSISDVKFTIDSVSEASDADKIKALIENAGLADVYASEISGIKSEFGDVISHNIRRIDTITGEDIDFGTVIGSTFSDVTSRISSTITNIIPGRKYRYVIATQFSNVDALLSSRVIEKEDKYGRKYKFLAKKFLNPITLKTGTLLPASNKSKQMPDDSVKLGISGNEKFIDIVIPTEKTQISNLVRAKVGNANSIKWNISGNTADFDHFQIYGIVDGVTTLLDRIQPIDETNFEIVTDEDPDMFIVLPIMIDFSQGTYVTVGRS